MFNIQVLNTNVGGFAFLVSMSISNASPPLFISEILQLNRRNLSIYLVDFKAIQYRFLHKLIKITLFIGKIVHFRIDRTVSWA